MLTEAEETVASFRYVPLLGEVVRRCAVWLEAPAEFVAHHLGKAGARIIPVRALRDDPSVRVLISPVEVPFIDVVAGRRVFRSLPAFILPLQSVDMEWELLAQIRRPARSMTSSQ